MELEGDLILERRRYRLWVSAAAVVVPVLACLAGVTWFIRAYISPPTIAIPAPMGLAAAQRPPERVERPVVPPSAPVPAAAGPPPAQPAPAPAQPALRAAFAAATAPPPFPPAPSREPLTASTAAHADPQRSLSAAAASTTSEIHVAPIAGPIPLPKPRRQASIASAGTVPLPLPRPEPQPPEETSAPAQPSQPAHDRHGAE